jgi:hypothetical protein
MAEYPRSWIPGQLLDGRWIDGSFSVVRLGDDRGDRCTDVLTLPASEAQDFMSWWYMGANRDARHTPKPSLLADFEDRVIRPEAAKAAEIFDRGSVRTISVKGRRRRA